MDFVDWRKSPKEIQSEKDLPPSKPKRLRGKRYYEYVDELIQKAQERGDFDNLPGAGKPLNLDDENFAGDKALGYHLLKSNGFAPTEVELAKEIRTERERVEAKLARVIHQGKTLRSRRVPPFPSQKRAFNAAVEKAAREYEETLRNLNRKILDLNLTSPSQMHQTFIEVEHLVENFRDTCPLFVD